MIGGIRMLKIKNILNTKVKGVAGFESILLSPLMMITYMLIFYFAFTAISYIQLNNLAEVIAQDLNMRQTGYDHVKNVSKPNYQFDIYEVIGQNSFINGYKPKPSPKADFNITTNSPSPAVAGALNYSIGKHGYRLFMPGIQIKEIRANVFRNGVVARNFDNIKMTGTSIEITIKYKAFGLSYTASGYNIIV